MMTARWQVDARFGHKDAVVALMTQWWRDIAPRIGWSADKARLHTGSVGVGESRIEIEVSIANLAQLESAWARLTETRDQERWAEELAPHVVSGSARWTVYRTVPLNPA